MNKRPFLVVGLTSFLSALICSYLPWRWAACVFVVPLGLAGAAYGLRRKRKVGSLWMAAVGTTLVIAMFLCRTALVAHPALAYGGEMVTVTARVCETLVLDQPCRIRVTDCDLPKGTMLLLWGDRFAGHPKEGDLVSGELLLTAAYDYDSENGRAAKAAGVYLYAWTKQGVSMKVIDGEDSMTLAERVVFGLRRAIRETLVQYLPKTQAGLCRSITIGDRSALDAGIADDFRASGVYHLLAVSGLHLSVITGAVLSLLKASGLRRRPRAVVTMAAVFLFMALCGFTPSVVRAGVMTCLCLSGGLFRRQADGLNSLGFAAFAMLCVDPFCVWDLGWQLSFAATLGLLVLFPVWQREVTARCRAVKVGAKAATWLSEAVGVSLSASLLTHPLTALYFGEVSTVFLLGNLLCVSVGSLLLITLFAALMLCSLLPSGAGLLFVAANGLCEYLIVCTDALAAISYAMVHADLVVTVWLFVLAAVLPLAYWRGRMRAVVRACAAMAAVLVVLSAASTVLSFNKVTLTAPDTNTPVVLVKSINERGLIVSGERDAWEKAQRLCDRYDVYRVDWLLWLPSTDNTAPDEDAFTVRVSHLVLGHAVKDASKFPDATEVSVLQDGDVMCGKRVSMCVRQGAAMLTVGEETVLICPSGQAVADLPSEWKAPDCLLVCGDVPQDIGCITAKQTVVFGKRSAAEQIVPLLPPATESVCVFVQNEWTYTVKTR